MCSKLSPMRIFLHSQKLLSINSHFTKCAASSKFIRRWLTVTHHTLSVYVKPTKTHTFSERHKFKFEVKWYIIANCSQSGWETHTSDSSWKDYMLGNCPEWSKPVLSLIWSPFYNGNRVEKIIVNQTISFSQVIPKCMETISNLKKANIQKTWPSYQL